MKTRLMTKLLLLALPLLGAGCENSMALDNPNERTAESFWKTESDALMARSALYSSLYTTWQIETPLDGRTDLAEPTPGVGSGQDRNVFATVITDLNFATMLGWWTNHLEGIYRSNMTLAKVPAMEINPTLKNELIAEAKFFRALYYFNLVTIFGNVPLITEPLALDARPAFSGPAAVYAQMEKDLTDAAAVLPSRHTGANVGRVTKGAALSLLGETLMMQKKWAEGAAALKQVIDLGVYTLLPDYGSLFTLAGENSSEGIFEIQWGDVTNVPLGARGASNPNAVGPAGVGNAGVIPTHWYFQQFFAERGPSSPDPRLDVTLFWNRPGGMDVFGRTFVSRYPNGYAGRTRDQTYFWKKYQTHWMTTSDGNNPINFKVYRLGKVLLLYAEALTEAGQQAAALAPLNQVRARVGMPAVPAGLSQSAMRDRINHEFLMELGWEQSRLPYLKRHGLFTKEYLLTRNPFHGQFFVNGKSDVFPIPQSEIELNQNATQNPGW